MTTLIQSIAFSREEDEGEDEVDSDFSIDENDEPVSDQEQDGPKKKRQVMTMAYKEPKQITAKLILTPKERKPKHNIPRQNKIFNDSTGLKKESFLMCALKERKLKQLF